MMARACCLLSAVPDSAGVKEKTMTEKNETVTIELAGSIKMKLAEQISRRMIEFGKDPENLNGFELGFELPTGWPADKGVEVTVAQLTVLAHELKMQIEICDLNMSPMKKES